MRPMATHPTAERQGEANNKRPLLVEKMKNEKMKKEQFTHTDTGQGRHRHRQKHTDSNKSGEKKKPKMDTQFWTKTKTMKLIIKTQKNKLKNDEKKRWIDF